MKKKSPRLRKEARAFSFALRKVFRDPFDDRPLAHAIAEVP